MLYLTLWWILAAWAKTLYVLNVRLASGFSPACGCSYSFFSSVRSDLGLLKFKSQWASDVCYYPTRRALTLHLQRSPDPVTLPLEQCRPLACFSNHHLLFGCDVWFGSRPKITGWCKIISEQWVMQGYDAASLHKDWAEVHLLRLWHFFSFFDYPLCILSPPHLAVCSTGQCL